MENTNNPMQIITIPIENELVCLRGLCHKRVRFELEYALERGSTDNSFLFTNNKYSNRPNNGKMVSGRMTPNKAEIKKRYPHHRQKVLGSVGKPQHG